MSSCQIRATERGILLRMNPPSAPTAAPVLGLHDFAFLTGSWRVHHRKLRRRLVGDTGWMVFAGTCRAWEILDGAGNVDDNFLEDPAGPYRAATLRRCDPATGLWSIWWADTRRPGLDPPVHGRFTEGIGTFLGQDTHEGTPVTVRFLWSGITAVHARWEQSFSTDGGGSWESNWVMDFERADSELVPPA